MQQIIGIRKFILGLVALIISGVLGFVVILSVEDAQIMSTLLGLGGMLTAIIGVILTPMAYENKVKQQ